MELQENPNRIALATVQSVLNEMIQKVEYHNRISFPLCRTTKEFKSFPISKVVAPMVGQSDLPFRILCRRYGADVCYTEMFQSELFAECKDYRNTVLKTSKEDRPLVVQFCGNDPAIMVAAAMKAQSNCDAIDINLGCPQLRAQEGHYGAYLLGKKDWPLVFTIVHALSTQLEVPVFCKTRLCDQLQDTLDFVRGLEAAGCSVIVVHGRKRGSKKQRRCGPADFSAIKAVKDILHIPVISNGNIQGKTDIATCFKKTKADGVMSAEGILRNPAIFDDASEHVRSVGDLATEYLKLCNKESCPPPRACIKQHLSWMLGKTGHGRTIRYKYFGNYTKHVHLCDSLNQAQTLADFQIIVDDCLQNVAIV